MLSKYYPCIVFSSIIKTLSIISGKKIIHIITKMYYDIGYILIIWLVIN